MASTFETLSGSRVGTAATATPLPQPSFDESFARLDGLANLLDSAFRIPGTSVVMGLDALLGLVPVIGDAVSGAIASCIIWEARSTKATRFPNDVACDRA